jgi:hypothetical protein
MTEGKSLNHDPLSDADAILSEDFYGRRSTPPRPAHGQGPSPAGGKRPPLGTGANRRRKKPKPTHYKVMCISMYNKDIEVLEDLVAELKRRGYTKANKSQVIRMALGQMDLDKLELPPR